MSSPPSQSDTYPGPRYFLKVRGEEQSATKWGKPFHARDPAPREGSVSKWRTTCCWHHESRDDDADNNQLRDHATGRMTSCMVGPTIGSSAPCHYTRTHNLWVIRSGTRSQCLPIIQQWRDMVIYARIRLKEEQLRFTDWSRSRSHFAKSDSAKLQ